MIVFALVTAGLGRVVGSFAVGATLGVFCAVWGGVGFGLMFAGALAVMRHEPSQRG